MALLAQCGQAGWLSCRQGWCRPGQNWAELSKQRLLLQGSGGGSWRRQQQLTDAALPELRPRAPCLFFSCYRRRSFSLPPSMVRLLFSSAQAIRRRQRRAAQACKQKLHRAQHSCSSSSLTQYNHTHKWQQQQRLSTVERTLTVCRADLRQGGCCRRSPPPPPRRRRHRRAAAAKPSPCHRRRYAFSFPVSSYCAPLRHAARGTRRSRRLCCASVYTYLHRSCLRGFSSQYDVT